MDVKKRIRSCVWEAIHNATVDETAAINAATSKIFGLLLASGWAKPHENWRGILWKVADFLEEESEMRQTAGSIMSDYAREPGDLRDYVLSLLSPADVPPPAKDAEG